MMLPVQGPSPDEVALVEGGRQLGYEFVARDRTSITIRMLGEEVSISPTLGPSLYRAMRLALLHQVPWLHVGRVVRLWLACWPPLGRPLHVGCFAVKGGIRVCQQRCLPVL